MVYTLVVCVSSYEVICHAVKLLHQGRIELEVSGELLRVLRRVAASPRPHRVKESLCRALPLAVLLEEPAERIGEPRAPVLLVFGLVFLLFPGFVSQTFGIFAGIAMLINGASGLISFFQMRKE